MSPDHPKRPLAINDFPLLQTQENLSIPYTSIIAETHLIYTHTHDIAWQSETKIKIKMEKKEKASPKSD